MLNKITVAFVLIGLLATCTPKSVDINKEAMPSASPSQIASPIPSDSTSPLVASVVPTATSTPSPSPTRIAPERCTLGGYLTYDHIVPREIIQTSHEFNFKDIQAPRFMCHNPTDDTLVVTNQKEVLSFDPKTSKIETLIDENLMGFSSDQGSKFRFQNIRECIVDKTGNLYFADTSTSEVYYVNLEAKRIMTLQHRPYDYFSPTSLTTKFSFNVYFALTPQNQVLLADSQHLYTVDNSNLKLLFRTYFSNNSLDSGIRDTLFPQKVGPNYMIRDMASIEGIATDDKGNIYMTSTIQNALFKLTPDKKVFLVNPTATHQLYETGARYLPVSTMNTFEYVPKYGVFFGSGPVIFTRDGCFRAIAAPPDSDDAILGSSYITDIASTNDGSIYIFDSEKMRISRLEIPPDLPEKAQWEPPQAWKDATGME